MTVRSAMRASEPNLILGRMLQMASPNVMVVSHILQAQQVFARVLGQFGVAPILASTVKEAQTILSSHTISFIFCSDELPGGGIDSFIRQTSRPPGKIPVVVVSRFDDWQRYLNFLQAGAFDYILYPPSSLEIERIVKSALSHACPAIQGSSECRLEGEKNSASAKQRLERQSGG